MYLTGFADEASTSFDGQIRATKELGWKYIESRAVDGRNIHDISDEQFEQVIEKLGRAGIEINCFGSAVANWGKSIEEPMDSSIAEIKRAIPRMKRLGTKLVRIMSFAVRKDRGPDDQMKEERFRRLRDICGMFRSEGLTAVHENCMNYGGMGWTYTLELIENVPGLKLVFDTGNCFGTDDRTKAKPYPKQDSWEFYSHVKEHIAYVHIKDGRFDREKNDLICTYPGEGDAHVRKIVRDLIAGGYDGGFSIEPHMAVVFHDSSVKSSEEAKHAVYVEYGRRMQKMLDEINAELSGSGRIHKAG